jgi:hypothetical protein
MLPFPSAERGEARAWLATPSADLDLALEFARLDPAAAREALP